jgi:GT2 family glycosyltransferase
MFDIVCSIVSYKEDKNILLNNIKSVLNTKLNIKVVLVDNSPTDNLSELKNLLDIDYIFNNSNFGYGRAHNVAIKKYQGSSKYNIIMNPDVVVKEGTLESLFDYMEKNEEIGLVMPDVLYPDGERQYLCKRIPKAKDLILRRFAGVNPSGYEMRSMDYTKPFDAPILSGCFMFIRSSILNSVGLFDERFFMYMEDVDLSRRINQKYKTMFYPYSKITHDYKKGSYKNPKLLYHHVLSAIKYFNKWGWFA